MSIPAISMSSGNRGEHLDDGLILMDLPDPSQIDWQLETLFQSFNVYSGEGERTLHLASWKITPRLVRVPESRRLTP